MTPADLDRLQEYLATRQAVDEDASCSLAQHELADLLRLARRGLRAEHETCGRCEHRESAFDGKGFYCYMLSSKVKDTDHCSRWRAKEER